MALTTDKLDEQKEELVAAYLNLYLFQNVWNESYRAFRNNVLPRRMTKRAVNGSISTYGLDLSLPNDTDPFYIFSSSRTALGGLVWPKNLKDGWISTEDLNNEYGILLDVYHIHGKMLTKKDVYIYNLPQANGYLIAINKVMYNKILKTEELDGIRFTIYYDYDMANKVTVKSWDVPVRDTTYGVRWEIWKEYQAWLSEEVEGRKPAVLFFINGVEISNLPGAGAIPVGSTVWMEIDRNVYLDMVFDLTDPYVNAQFFSEMDKVYKQIIHIPKDKNPEQLLMTHNAFEIYARKKLPEEDGSYHGLYLHRCAERTVTQITHQDIGIPVYILDAFRDYLGTSEIVLRVYWRRHEDTNVLVRDKNYIDLLYELNPTDENILDYLAGMHKYSNELYFWKAAHLEQSEYVKMMFDVPDVINISNMYQYVEALGYYNTMFLLSRHVMRAVITEAYRGAYLFEKPLIYQDNPVAALVYADGYKVPEKDVNLKNNSDTHVSVGVNENWATLGTQLIAEFHRDGPKDIYRIIPDKNNNELIIPLTNYDVIIETESDVPVMKFDYVSDKGYEPYQEVLGNIIKRDNGDNTLTLTFGVNTYGKTFYIQLRPRTYYWSSENPGDGINLQEKMNNAAPLYFQLLKPAKYSVVDNENQLTEGVVKVPVWDLDSVIVYINGRYLIKDIDFTIQEVLDRYDKVALKILVIQNYSYLKQDGENTMEVYCTSAVDENREYGYCAPRTVEVNIDGSPTPIDADIKVVAAIRDNRTVLYNKDASVIHVNGYITEADVKGNFVTKKSSWKREWEIANPVEIRTTVPYFISDYISRYHENDDLERIETINKIYFNYDLRKVDIELIKNSHFVYSVYAATVLRDVLFGYNKELSYDPDLPRMHAQLDRYKYIADIDLVYQKKLDLHYVDTYPHYLQLTAPDVEMYQLLQALVRATLPPDPISNKRDVDLTHP